MLDQASRLWRRDLRKTKACGGCLRNSASSSMRKGACPLAMSTRTFASTGRATGTFAVTLAGEDALAAECAAAETGDVAAQLGLAFLALAGAGEASPRRMRALVEREGAEAIFAKAALRAKPCKRSRRRPALREIFGAHAYGAEFVVGAAAAFGEIEAFRFKALIERARALNARSLRLTPWRAFLIAGLDRQRRRVVGRYD